MLRHSQLEVRRLHSVLNAAFAQLLEIYMEANEPGERKSPEQLAVMIQEPGYHFLAALESGVVVGLQILRLLEGCDAALLEYNAVAHDRRSTGIGSALFRKMAGLEEFANRFLLAEVGSDKKPGADQEERTRRKEFYRRLGWREIEGLDYIMPPVSSTMPSEMDMLVYARELPDAIERERIRRWLERSYADVYGLPADDPRVDAIMGPLPALVRLI